MISACGDLFDLDLQEDPNSPTSETADLESLFNSTQLEFGQALASAQFFTMQLSRQRAMTAGNIYATAFGPQAFDGLWSTAYAGFIPDADAVIALATPTEQLYHVGAAKVMKAFVLMQMVDIFGDVPLSEAGQGIGNVSPDEQSGESVYDAANILLDEALDNFAANTAAAPVSDLFYGGTIDGWIAAANTLRLRSALYTRDWSTFDAIIEADSYINSSDLDWQAEYGSTRMNPDSRHPLYVNSYEANDGHYMSNWLMWVMTQSRGVMDPRTRFYFYRTISSIPTDDANRFDCIFSVLPDPDFTPSHYLNCDDEMPYCVASLDGGYFGRDHGNANGIPPDGDVRTVYGVYPAGGKFDNNINNGVQNDGVDGALGAGIHPILTSFFVDFYRAEAAALRGDEAGAKTLMLTGIQNSINKVRDFGTSADMASLEQQVASNPVVITGADFVPGSQEDSTYLAAVAEMYDDAGDPFNVLATEFLVSTYGNGLEGYNLIRRTAHPTNMQPMLETGAGPFIRSALYPANHVNLNQNATQKSVTDKVFWDISPDDLGPCF